MKNDLSEIILFETTVLFENIEKTFDFITDELMEKTILKWPVWKHFYHMLHSLDQWFINPNSYSQPPFHEQGMNTFGSNDTKGLSKDELRNYFSSIKKKIVTYISTLTLESLAEKPKNCKFTRMDLLLSQYRHVMYNLGLIHAMLQARTGAMPNYVGISQPIENPFL